MRGVLTTGALLVLLLAVLLVLGGGGASRAFAAESTERVLVVVLDGLAFGVAEQVLAEAGLAPPALLVSAFPATTHLALSGALETSGAARSPGYESRYFDWQRRRPRGGGLFSYRRMEFDWRRRIDWLGPGVWGNAVGALRPLRDSLRRIDRAMAAFASSAEETFWVHIGSTDRLGHLAGPEAGAEALGYLLTAVDRLRSRQNFRLVVFSDHGMEGGERLINVLKPVRQVLRAAGYRSVDRLRQPRDVALTPFGLVSSFELYSEPEIALDVARRTASVDGVDLCVVPEAADLWRVVSDRGEALIERRNDSDLRYFRDREGPDGGDPLGYLDGRAQNRTGSRTGSRNGSRTGAELEIETEAPASSTGWLSADHWLEQTRDHTYPDALYRISRAFDRVENAASAVCSTTAGHMYGALRTERAGAWTVGRLRWTHGALTWPSSAGFLWSDCPGAVPEAAVLRVSTGPALAVAACRSAPSSAGEPLRDAKAVQRR